MERAHEIRKAKLCGSKRPFVLISKDFLVWINEYKGTFRRCDNFHTSCTTLLYFIDQLNSYPIKVRNVVQLYLIYFLLKVVFVNEDLKISL